MVEFPRAMTALLLKPVDILAVFSMVMPAEAGVQAVSPGA
jgi:hypothetical protein